MKLTTVEFERPDLVNRFCGYGTRVEIKDFQSPEGLLFLHLTKGLAVSLKRHTTTQEQIESVSGITLFKDGFSRFEMNLFRQSCEATKLLDGGMLKDIHGFKKDNLLNCR